MNDVRLTEHLERQLQALQPQHASQTASEVQNRRRLVDVISKHEYVLKCQVRSHQATDKCVVF